MATELATGYVTILPSARGFRQALDKEIGGDLERAGQGMGDTTSKSFGKTFNSGIKKVGKAAAIGFAGAFAAGAVIGKQSIDAASDLEETQSKVNTVFGEGADIVNEWAKNSATAIGQSRQQALDAAGTFGNLFVQLGIGSGAAADMSTEMVTLASDFASFHNADPTEVIEAQTAAFRGEYDALQRFVPTINAATVEQKALEMTGKRTTKELTAQEKALATQAIMMDNAGAAAGDFQRTNDSLANQQRVLSARMEDAKATIGRSLLPAMTAIVTFISDKVIPAAQKLAEEWMPRLREGFELVASWVRDNWPQIQATVREVFEDVKAAFEGAIEFIQTIWANFGDQLTSIIQDKLKFVWEFIKVGFDTIREIIRTITALIKGDWSEVWEGLKGIFGNIWKGIKLQIENAVNTVKELLSIAWEIIASVAKKAWEGVRDKVMAPVREVRDQVTGAFQFVVDRVGEIWGGISAVYQTFYDKVFVPVRDKVWVLRDVITSAFERAVDGVETAWNMLKNIVKTPINAVIGFYNNGIRAVWNAVISKIPGIGNLPEVARLAFAQGGRVPGSGNRDTVPAMLTPGEFVITKGAAQRLGPKVLEELNRAGRTTLDPAVFGYAQGGYVRSPEEALAWARQQAGKPYKFPLVGPDAYDCSGLTSALINYIEGRNPHSRRHSSGTIGSDPAVAPGLGDISGLNLGSRPPFQRNSQGSLVGHIAATLAGVAVEATPPRVLVGGNARGANASTFTKQWHLPNYGGLGDEDKAIAHAVNSTKDMKLTGLVAPLGDLLEKMINRLPGMIFDFLSEKFADIMKKAGEIGLFAGPAGQLAAGFHNARRILGFQDGGTVRRDGPILVGERRPEILWANRGEYVQANAEGFGRQVPPITFNSYERPVSPKTIADGVRLARVS